MTAKKSTHRTTRSGARITKKKSTATRSKIGTKARGTATAKRATAPKSGTKNSGTRIARANAAAAAAARSRNRKIRIILALIGGVLICCVVLLHMMLNPERVSSDGFTHAAQFENSIVVDGIDVSYAQGDGASIDWSAVKKAGVDFVFIRAGYRSIGDGKLHKDSEFDENIQGAQEAGLMVGVYFYSQATTVKEAQKEAAKVLEYIDGYDIDLPIYIDYETYPDGRLETAMSKKSWTKKKATNIVLAFCSKIAEAGYEPGVYANYNMLVNNLQPKKIAAAANVWVAHYAEETSYSYGYSYWQCTDSQTVTGIATTVDKDFWYLSEDGVDTFGARNDDAISIRDCTVTLEEHSFRYLGRPIEPTISVTYGDQTLVEGQDYQVSYIKNTAAGTGYAVVTGLGDYKDMTATSFLIKGVL